MDKTDHRTSHNVVYCNYRSFLKLADTPVSQRRVWVEIERRLYKMAAHSGLSMTNRTSNVIEQSTPTSSLPPWPAHWPDLRRMTDGLGDLFFSSADALFFDDVQSRGQLSGVSWRSDLRKWADTMTYWPLALSVSAGHSGTNNGPAESLEGNVFTWTWESDPCTIDIDQTFWEHMHYTHGDENIWLVYLWYI